jgi:DNA-binding FrmR family transcriptional regulator
MPGEEHAVQMRLRSAEGHLHAVIQMSADGAPYEQVLHQLGAVQAALRAAGSALLREQVQDSLAALLQDPNEAVRQSEMKKLGAMYQLWKFFSLSFKETTKETS